MRQRLLLACVVFAILPVGGAEGPPPGQDVDLAPFGHAKTWDGNPGVEWDEPRDIRRVEVDFSDASQRVLNSPARIPIY
jgi:hypothetical protein